MNILPHLTVLKPSQAGIISYLQFLVRVPHESPNVYCFRPEILKSGNIKETGFITFTPDSQQGEPQIVWLHSPWTLVASISTSHLTELQPGGFAETILFIYLFIYTILDQITSGFVKLSCNSSANLQSTHSQFHPRTPFNCMLKKEWQVTLNKPLWAVCHLLFSHPLFFPLLFELRWAPLYKVKVHCCLFSQQTLRGLTLHVEKTASFFFCYLCFFSNPIFHPHPGYV